MYLLFKHNEIKISIFLSVYSPFSDRVGHPLHNIPSPFLLSWTSSLSISSSAISTSTLSNHVFGLPTSLLP